MIPLWLVVNLTDEKGSVLFFAEGYGFADDNVLAETV